VAHTRDAPELLDVEVDQLAGAFALVAHDRRLLIEHRQPVHTQPAQNPTTVDTATRSNKGSSSST
jgi:hypothetical protein